MIIKLKGQKLDTDFTTFAQACGIDHTMTQDQWDILTGNVKKEVIIEFKKSEKKKFNDKSEKFDE